MHSLYLKCIWSGLVSARIYTEAVYTTCSTYNEETRLMEFDFKKDYFSEKATVKLSMGHEAFATWLEQEGQKKDWVNELLVKIEALQKRELTEYKLAGSEFDLYLNIEEARVVNHSLHDSQSELEDDNDLHFYDQEIEAECGLEDFLNLISSWSEFI